MSDSYTLNKEYYDRNASNYEKSSWYFYNKYKDNSVKKEIELILNLTKKKHLKILEFGPGTGYLLSKIVEYPDLIIDMIRRGDGTKVYIITDKVTEDKYQFASKSLVWPSGYDMPV